jgi:uncharacterized protein YecE (DUF72 family)
VLKRPETRVGTSAFAADGWVGSFYPEGTKPADFLSVYAKHFDTVEVDSTYYRTPAASTVEGWAAKTPANFIFSAKVSQTITHEKVLLNCNDEFRIFVETMENLGDKLGPLPSNFRTSTRKHSRAAMNFSHVSPRF